MEKRILAKRYVEKAFASELVLIKVLELVCETYEQTQHLLPVEINGFAVIDQVGDGFKIMANQIAQTADKEPLLVAVGKELDALVERCQLLKTWAANRKGAGNVDLAALARQQEISRRLDELRVMPSKYVGHHSAKVRLGLQALLEYENFAFDFDDSEDEAIELAIDTTQKLCRLYFEAKLAEKKAKE